MTKAEPKKKKLLKQNKESFFSYLLFTCLFVFFVYCFSLFRPWLPFDEGLFYKEELFPIPTKFSEITEIIQAFVKGHHIESMNSLFSTNITVRSNPITAIIETYMFFFFKKNAIFYHLLQVGIHLLNTVLVWLIFYTIAKLLSKELNKFNFLIISLLTSIWALHCASTEGVLLVTNWSTLLTYLVCFCFLLYELHVVKNPYQSKLQSFLLSILFCLLMFITEYGYTLPFIVFFIILAFTYRESKELKKAFFISFNKSLPYFIGLFLFAVISASNSNSSLVNLFSSQEANYKESFFYLFIERNLWLVPQIFLHFVKILLFPKSLSAYQSNLVYLSHELFTTYSIFCCLVYLVFLIIPIILFLILKDPNKKFLLFLVYSFYFGVFPFLHILFPTYCLSADRYCYFPFFLVMLFVVSFLFSSPLLASKKNEKLGIIFISSILLIFTLRTLVRIQEWNSPYSFYNSGIKIEKNPLYKGHRLYVLANFVGEKGNNLKMEEYLQESLKELNKALKEFKAYTKNNSNEPITLKLYGLDYKSLVLKSAYLITAIKNDNYREPLKDTLAFYRPYIRKYKALAGANQIESYVDLLLKNEELKEAKETLDYGLQKYPKSSNLLYLLSDYFLLYEKDLDKAYKVLESTYKIYPNYNNSLKKLLKYYELKNDLINQANYLYLIGLREHSSSAYLKAAQIYLDLNQLPLARKTLKKLIWLTGENPVTLLLTSRYLDLTGRRSKILEILNKAYFLNKQLPKQDEKITKSILFSLVNVNSYLGNIPQAKGYLTEIEQLKTLSPDERNLTYKLKSKLGQK